MKLANALLIAILVIGAAGCSGKKDKKPEDANPVSDLNIVPDNE